LPGAGKTTLARRIAADGDPLRQALELPPDVGLHIEHVCYDELMRSELDRISSSCAFDVGAWRAARVEATRIARAMLSSPRGSDAPAAAAAAEADGPAIEAREQPGPPRTSERTQGPPRRNPVIVVLLDDNHHFRSMRKNAFQLARECDAAFVHVHVAAPVATALARNAARPRSDRVPEHLLLEMAASFDEIPERQPQLGWERTVLRVHPREDDDGTTAWPSVVSPTALVREWTERQVIDEPESEQLARSAEARAVCRRETLASALHQLDLRSRQTIARCMEALRQAPAAEKKAVAARLNGMRRELLAHAQAAAAPPGGDTSSGNQQGGDQMELLIDEAYAAFAYECRSASGGTPIPI
jgi:tRNA uridine 5-carbamoylmethylation protein Kti12